MLYHFSPELFINAIDLSPYIVGVSESGNIIGIKAPPETVRDVFLSLRGLSNRSIIFWDGDIINWHSFLPDELRGWLYIEIRKVNHRGVIEPSSLWLRFDE